MLAVVNKRLFLELMKVIKLKVVLFESV